MTLKTYLEWYYPRHSRKARSPYGQQRQADLIRLIGLIAIFGLCGGFWYWVCSVAL